MSEQHSCSLPPLPVKLVARVNAWAGVLFALDSARDTTKVRRLNQTNVLLMTKTYQQYSKHLLLLIDVNNACNGEIAGNPKNKTPKIRCFNSLPRSRYSIVWSCVFPDKFNKIYIKLCSPFLSFDAAKVSMISSSGDFSFNAQTVAKVDLMTLLFANKS